MWHVHTLRLSPIATPNLGGPKTPHRRRPCRLGTVPARGKLSPERCATAREAGSTAQGFWGSFDAYSPSVHGRRSRRPTRASRSARPRARSATPTAPSSSARTTSKCRRSWSQVACDVLAQKYFRKAGVPTSAEAGAGRRRAGIPVAQARRWHRDARRAFRQAGVRPPGRHLDLLGLEGRLFRRRSRCPRLL